MESERFVAALAHGVERWALVGLDRPDGPLPILIHGPQQHLGWR